jgi:hypothetical protein
MLETGPKYPYRNDVLESIVETLRSGKSCFVIAFPGMGKTRFIDYVLRSEVQKHFRLDDTLQTLFVRIDTNRLFSSNDWGIYELIFSSIMLCFGQIKELNGLQQEFMNVYTEMLLRREKADGLNYLDLVVEKLCRNQRLCFVIDEFDSVYRQLSPTALSFLQHLQTTTNGRVSYVAFLREFPDQLRPPTDDQIIYSIFSPRLVELGAYSRTDSMQLIEQLEERRSHHLTTQEREWLMRYSDGIPNFLLSLFSILAEDIGDADQRFDINWVANYPIVYQECDKLWQGLSDSEQAGLIEYVKNHNISSPDVYRLLRAKGILGHPDGTNEKIFSPVFYPYVKDKSDHDESGRVAQQTLKVFLCCSMVDQELTGDLYARLSSIKGADPWLAKYRLYPGDDWKELINIILEKTHVVIIGLSRAAVKREGYFQTEITRALSIADQKPEGTVFIIPVRFDECEIPRKLSRWYYVDYFEESGFERLLHSLGRRAKGLGIPLSSKSQYFHN